MPILILVLAAITGLTAFSRASRSDRRRWALVLGVLTAVGVVGPIVALSLFRDSPDRFVLTATVLTGLVPVTALLYSLVLGHER